MKRTLLISALLLVTAPFCFSQIPSSALTGKPKATEQIGFVENKGQLADEKGNALPDIFFKSTGTGPGIYITASGLTYVFGKPGTSVSKNPDDASNVPMNWAKVEMDLDGASIKKENIVCENELPGYSNFYYAHCPQGILNVKSYHHITIKNIYPGIDWVFNADEKSGMSHDFIVHPGADPAMIKVNYKGTNEAISMDQSGRLKISTEYGVMYEGGLNVYEQQSGKKIAANFNIKKNKLKFSLENYNTNDLLVIDPPLQWSMPQASGSFDYGYSIAAAHDGTGDVLVTGASDGTNFPVQNAYQGLLYGFEDMVIVRLNAAGTRLWSTYYGGTDYEQGKSVASDAAGNCYVAGNTGSNDFPLLNELQTNYGNGVYDLAIVKLNAAGVRQFATWYGASGNEYGTGIAADAAGNFYVTGYTSSQFYITTNPLQATKGAGYDLFIMKVNANYTMNWNTFFGGNDDDKGRAITIDAAGTNIYITGTTLANNFPVTSGVFQQFSSSAFNAEEAFILKMSTAQVVQFCSYCGGTDGDFGQGIAVDYTGNIFITGYTLSSDFPIVNPGGGAYVDSTIGSIGTHDAFIAACNSTGTTRLWSTYFGGTSPDMAFAIAADPYVGIYICGNTASTDFPTQQPADNNFYQSVQGDAGTFNDMFIAWFGANDSLKWSTYYGGANSDEGYGICVDASNNIFVTGVSNDDLEVTKFGPGFPTGITDGPYVPHLFVYPNPTNETLHLRFDSYGEGTFNFEIYNAQGQLLSRSEKNIAASPWNFMEFDLTNYATGIYFLKVCYPNGSAETMKFMRE
jgi:hypothetical protein